MVVFWGIVVPHIAHASFCDNVDCSRERSRAYVTTTDPFSMEEKSDESQFDQNLTIYLKTRKMLSQWTKQMRWRIKKSLPSFVSYVDVERMVNRNHYGMCCGNSIILSNFYLTEDQRTQQQRMF